MSADILIAEGLRHARILELADVYREAWENEREAEAKMWQAEPGDLLVMRELTRAEEAAKAAKHALLKHIRMRPGRKMSR